MSDSQTLFLVPTDQSGPDAKVHIWSGLKDTPSLCRRADRKMAYRLEEHPFNLGEVLMCRACSFKLLKILDWIARVPTR